MLEDSALAHTLPAVFTRLAADDIASFPALRPHQRPAWHMLLVQLGALACLRGSDAVIPVDEEGWATAFRALTPQFPEDAPWHLVGPEQQPAFMQPVLPNFTGYKDKHSPDEIDALILSRNHDLKARRMVVSLPDDWLFALVTRQTMDGGSAAGQSGRYHSISRMNSESGNRPFVGAAPLAAGFGGHVLRDIRRLVALRDDLLDRSAGYDYAENGLALVWLEPWDGVTSLLLAGLDPYYIEICRRLRLVSENGRITALVAGSKAPRIAMPKELCGVTGDPRAPVEHVKGKAKALTVDARGFGYRRMSRILFGQDFERAPLQEIGADEPPGDYAIWARALARGQGVTEGLHERRVIVPRKARSFQVDHLGDLGRISQERIEQSGKLSGILRHALMVLFQKGPAREDFAAKDRNSAKLSEPFRERFEVAINRDFFDRLFQEAVLRAEGATETDRLACRAAWLKELLEHARAVLRTAETGAPISIVRHRRAMARAEATLTRRFYHEFGPAHFPSSRPIEQDAADVA